LLRLNEKALLFEGLLQLLALQGLPSFSLSSSVILADGVSLACNRGLDSLAGGAEESSGGGSRPGLARRLLKGFSRKELVTAHTLVTCATVIAEIAARIHGETLLFLQTRLGAAGEFELAYTHFRRRIVVVFRRYRWYKYGGTLSLSRLILRLI